MATAPVAPIDRLGLVDSGLVDRKSGKPICVLPQSVTVHRGRRITRIVNSNQTISASMANANSITTYVLDTSAFDSAKQLTVRFRVSLSGGTAGSCTRLLPTPMWFRTIELWYRGSGRILLQRWYPEHLMAAVGLRQPSDVQAMAGPCCWNEKTMWAGAPQNNAASQLYDLWLPGFWESGLTLNGRIDLGSTQLELVFYGAGGIVAGPVPTSSTAGTPSVDECLVLIESEVGQDGVAIASDQKAHIAELSKCVQAGVFLDPVQLLDTGKSLTAGQGYTTTLESFIGKCAALLVMVGAQAGAASQSANFASMTYLPLEGAGSNVGTLDLQDNSGTPLTTGSGPFEAGRWRSWMGSRWFNWQYLKTYNIYPIVFANSLDDALSGVVNDYHQFDGSQYRLRLTMPGAGTNEVMTVTQSGTPASGAYALGWTDSVSGITSWTADLAYNTSAANMAAAFNALESVVQSRLTVAFNQAASAGAAYTATFTDISGAPVDLKGNMIQVRLNTMATSAPATVTISSVVRTTPGIPGWPITGAQTVNIQVFALMHRVAKKSFPPALEVVDL